jgi:hypothetical protein
MSETHSEAMAAPEMTTYLFSGLTVFKESATKARWPITIAHSRRSEKTR